jgi:antitoxin VapB
MALNIKSPRVERLAAEVAALTGESKTEAIRKALEERRARLAFRVVRQDRGQALARYLEREVWSAIPAELLGRPRDREAEERALGFGPEGV